MSDPAYRKPKCITCSTELTLESHAPGTSANYCPQCKVFPDHTDLAVSRVECAPHNMEDKQYAYMKKVMWAKDQKILALNAELKLAFIDGIRNVLNEVRVMATDYDYFEDKDAEPSEGALELARVEGTIAGMIERQLET